MKKKILKDFVLPSPIAVFDKQSINNLSYSYSKNTINFSSPKIITSNNVHLSSNTKYNSSGVSTLNSSNFNPINNTTATTSNDRTLFKNNLLNVETSDMKEGEPCSPISMNSNKSLLVSSPVMSPSSKKLKFNENEEDKENINSLNVINNSKTIDTINNTSNINKTLDQKISNNNLSLKHKIKRYYSHRLSNNTLLSSNTTAISTASPLNTGSNSIQETNISNKSIHHNILGIRNRNRFDNKQSHR